MKSAFYKFIKQHISEEDLEQEYQLHKFLKPESKQSRNRFYIDYLRKTFGGPTRTKQKYWFNGGIENFRSLENISDIYDRSFGDIIDFKVDAERILQGFSEKELQIIKYRTYGYNFAEIGNFYNVSESRACQWLKGIQERIHARIEEKTACEESHKITVAQILFTQRQRLEFQTYQVLANQQSRGLASYRATGISKWRL